MVVGQENLADTDESKLVRESEDRLVLHFFILVLNTFWQQITTCTNYSVVDFITAGPGLTTDWSLATATALEAPTRMKRVSCVGSHE